MDILEINIVEIIFQELSGNFHPSINDKDSGSLSLIGGWKRVVVGGLPRDLNYFFEWLPSKKHVSYSRQLVNCFCSKYRWTHVDGIFQDILLRSSLSWIFLKHYWILWSVVDSSQYSIMLEERQEAWQTANNNATFSQLYNDFLGITVKSTYHEIKIIVDPTIHAISGEMWQAWLGIT